MKSGISSIFVYLVFCTHLVQIQVLDFLLESSAYQPFRLILQFELHGFSFKYPALDNKKESETSVPTLVFLELEKGLEPSTSSLRVRYSTN